MSDYDKMAFKKYTGKAERDKFLNILKGILAGISIDSNINNKEVQELHHWCSLLGEYADTKPFDELLPLISDSLSDNILTPEEIEDINWVIDKFTSNNKIHIMIRLHMDYKTFKVCFMVYLQITILMILKS